jgi:sortase A
MRFRHSLFFRVIRAVLLLTGIACLGVYVYSYLDMTMYQSYESRRFDQAKISSTVPHAKISHNKSAPVIGRISVPRLHLTAMVQEGVDDDVLRRAVGHVPGTPLPGESGNVGLAGHRDTFFRDLRNIRSDDEVDFETLGGRFSYVVQSVVVVEPSRVEVLAPSDTQSLTLVTCFPFNYTGNAPKRFVVRAVRRVR